MKKILVIVLLLVVCISVVAVDTVLAKVSFGGWDKWDEELPPADNEAWYWAVSDNEPRTWLLKGWGDAGSDVVLLFSDLYFYGDKKGKTKASVIFYSSGKVDLKDWDIPNADLALAAFPPKKGKIIIRAYKMEDKIFKFFEQWEIPFKDQEIVVPQDRKFRGIFEEWIKKQISSERTVPEDMPDSMLPELRIWEKKFFWITDCQKLSKK